MSFNRENIAWPATDGTWSIGFYSFYETGDTRDEDHDPEWDVDYDTSQFWWTSTGHQTADAAMDAYSRIHGNPGGGNVMPDRAANPAECERLDAMVIAMRERKARRPAAYPW